MRISGFSTTSSASCRRSATGSATEAAHEVRPPRRLDGADLVPGDQHGRLDHCRDRRGDRDALVERASRHPPVRMAGAPPDAQRGGRCVPADCLRAGLPAVRAAQRHGITQGPIASGRPGRRSARRPCRRTDVQRRTTPRGPRTGLADARHRDDRRGARPARVHRRRPGPRGHAGRRGPARLYLSKSVVDVLTPDEHAAVLAHEAAHRRRRDNLARWIMLATPDLFAATRFGRRTSEEWAAAAERIADEEAVGDSQVAKVALASALVKVARLMPPAPRIPLPTSGLDDGNILAERVKRLLREPSHPRPHVRAWLSATTIAGVGAAVMFASGELALHRSIHDVTEWLVRVSW